MRSLVLAAALMLGCGLPGAQPTGSTCDPAEVQECFSDKRVSICESGKWADYSCPSDCSNNQATRCDWTQAKVGQACPKSFEGIGLACGVEGSATILKCVAGKIESAACRNCVDRSSSTTRYFTCS